MFAALWLRLGTRNPSSPAKFAIGLVLLAVAFALMIGAASAAAGGARVSPMWLVLSYLFQVLGELCLSPVGLSAMSRLAPARVAGLVMGVWFLASAVGNFLAGIGGERLRDDAAAHALHDRHGHRAGGRAGAGADDQADPTDAGALTA